ncbi:MAG: MATE family efflux transporter [Sandaracinobacteroides sp.]
MDAIISSTSRAPDGTYRELLKLAGPNVVSRLGIMAMGLTDAIVVGQYSAVELGYHSLGWAPTVTVLVAGIGLLIGVQVLTARMIGAGQPERTGAILRRGLTYALKIGIVSTIVLVLLGPPFLHRMGLEPAVADGASAVLIVFSLSLTPYLLADALWFWLEGHGKPQVPMVAMWIANAVNLALALWIVPGTSPFPVAGAEAAAWVTLVARVALLVMLAWWVWRWPESRTCGVFRPAPRERAAEQEQRRIGYASGASFAIEAGSFSGINFIAGQLGVLVVAGWAVVMNVAAVVFMVPLGIAAAGGVLISRSVGAQHLPGVKRAYRMAMLLSLAVLAALSIVIFADAELIARAYSSDPALLAMTGSAILLSCLFFMADGAQVVSAQALRARGDIWWPTGMHFVSYALVMLPLCWWLGVHRGMGLDGIIWGVIAASLVSATALIWRFRALGNFMKQVDG